MQGTLSNKFEK